jgi:hypothetical protein
MRTPRRPLRHCAQRCPQLAISNAPAALVCFAVTNEARASLDCMVYGRLLRISRRVGVCRGGDAKAVLLIALRLEAPCPCHQAFVISSDVLELRSDSLFATQERERARGGRTLRDGADRSFRSRTAQCRSHFPLAAWSLCRWNVPACLSPSPWPAQCNFLPQTAAVNASSPTRAASSSSACPPHFKRSNLVSAQSPQAQVAREPRTVAASPHPFVG